MEPRDRDRWGRREIGANLVVVGHRPTGRWRDGGSAQSAPIDQASALQRPGRANRD